jgi:RNA polymerase sigma-70 factor, ECF subfamily
MEWELIQRCRRGSRASFEPLVRTHQRAALSIAEALLGNADDAADAVQEAFVKAFSALGRLRDGSSFGPWFRAIVRNHCRDRLRVSRPPQEAWSEEVVDPELWSEASAELSIEREELADAVRSALAAISPEHREILVLKEMEELSYAEIAGIMQIPPGTVASRLYNARAALRKILLQRGVAIEGATR